MQAFAQFALFGRVKHRNLQARRGRKGLTFLDLRGFAGLARGMQWQTESNFPSAMNSLPATATAAPVLHNFLFMLPASTTPAEQEVMVNLARRLTTMGYVYIASALESTMEDREDIRFMPFHVDLLPSFGAMTGVFIVRDQSIATAARETYPEAHVLVVDPDRVQEDLPDYEPEVISSWPLPNVMRPGVHTELAAAA